MTQTPATPTESHELFTPLEREQFDADDVTAGRAIGKMLSLLFLYTVIVMSLVSWWTFRTVADRGESPSATAESDN